MAASPGKAAVTRRFTPSAPWLPPITSSTGLSGSSPSAERAPAGSIAANCGRTGVPDTVTHGFQRRSAASGKPTKHSSTTCASQRLARPGRVFDSCRKVTAPARFPASTGGALVKPPIASTACGGASRNARRAARKERTPAAAKAGRLPPARPIAGRVTISNSSARHWTACWSTSFGETRRITSQPRATSSWPTARPGNRWPPVPPHAMATRNDGRAVFIRAYRCRRCRTDHRRRGSATRS